MIPSLRVMHALQASTVWVLLRPKVGPMVCGQGWLVSAHLRPGRDSVEELDLRLVPSRAVEPHECRPVLEPKLAALMRWTRQNTEVKAGIEDKTQRVAHHDDEASWPSLDGASIQNLSPATVTANRLRRCSLTAVRASSAHLELRIVRGAEEGHQAPALDRVVFGVPAAHALHLRPLLARVRALV